MSDATTPRGAGVPPATVAMPGDQARASVMLAVSQADAFDIFTRETDLWWRRGLRFRAGGRAPGALHFEPGVGGRLFEEFEGTSGPQLVEFGRVTVWEPPVRLVFEWRNVNFAPGEKTEVDVRFEEAPSGTRVTVTHRGWAAIPADHPARHGEAPAVVIRRLGLWWGELLSALREHAARHR
ncbi:MAG: SRPBCC domain-containing protein [Steroidobacteraceae bacterium]